MCTFGRRQVVSLHCDVNEPVTEYMHGIHEFLSRYTHLTPPDMVVRKKLAILIAQEIGGEISERNIRIIGPVAYCAFDGARKNAILLKKEKILGALEEEFGKRILADVQ